MIEAYVIEALDGPAHAVDPPGISLLLHYIPAIQRMAPALSVFAEKIRGHSRDDFGIKLGTQMKQIGMRPNIGAVEINEDRDIAHHSNGMTRAMAAKRLPLFEEKKLHGAADVEFGGHFGARFFNRRRISMSQFARPVVPAFQLETRP